MHGTKFLMFISDSKCLKSESERKYGIHFQLVYNFLICIIVFIFRGIKTSIICIYLGLALNLNTKLNTEIHKLVW